MVVVVVVLQLLVLCVATVSISEEDGYNLKDEMNPKRV